MKLAATMFAAFALSAFGCEASPPDAPTAAASGDAGLAPPTAEAGPEAAKPLEPSPARCAERSSGAVRVAVIVVNAGDANAPCAVEQVRERVVGAGGVRDYYRETSDGRLELEGDVFGPVQIPALTACVGKDSPGATTEMLRQWYAQADAAAEASGIDLSSYTRRMYVMPPSASCGGGGVSRPAMNRAWVFRCEQTAIYAHELGHVLGVDHASSAEGDYGDGSDVMGHGLLQLNGPHRAELGWLPADRVVRVTSSGTYRIGALEAQSQAPQVLTITRRDNPARAIHLSVRKRIGFDAALDDSFVGRTSVHEYVAACATTPTPTMLLATLADGQAHTATGSGVTITQVAHDGDTATIQVRFDPE